MVGKERNNGCVWTKCLNVAEGKMQSCLCLGIMSRWEKKGCRGMESIFEKLGGMYHLGEDGVYYPEIAVSNEKCEIGKYGRLRCKYLKRFHHRRYAALVLKGELHKHLQEVKEECFRQMERLVENMKKRDGVTEELKAENQMLWVRKMNHVQAMAEKIVLREVVYVR